MDKLLIKDIRAVLFDVDNTLLASNEFVLSNLRQTVDRCRSAGLKIASLPDTDLMSVLAKNLPFEQIFINLFPDCFQQVLADYRQHALNQPYNAIAGAVSAVKSLVQAGIVVGLVTNRVKMLTERLTQAGFTVSDFAFMCMPPTPELSKPHPRAFESALKLLADKGICASQVVVCGDHTDDYFSATYQDLKFVGVLSGLTSAQEFVQAGLSEQLIVSDLQNIEAILKKVVQVEIYKQSLQQTSALDGRHAVFSHALSHYFSEYALHKYRVKVEVEHLITLSEFFAGSVVRLFTDSEKQFLRGLYENFSPQQAYQVLQYDHLGRNGMGPTEHDVKSCELWIREKLVNTTLADVAASVHLFVTSEDINNLAYKCMLSDAVNEVFVPAVYRITNRLKDLTRQYLADPLMSRTHLQSASPTTFGKVFANYLSRLTDGLNNLYNLVLRGKANGSVGNYNAFVVAYPQLDWPAYSQALTHHLGFMTELWTDQRGAHSDMIRVFSAVAEINNVVRDLATDLSLYAGLGNMYFTKIESHVGSSVMPHKINPWFAEVAEGNCTKANYLINCFSNELDVSRLQRDLSDHDHERSYGEALGYVLIAVEHLQIALNLIKPDLQHALQELETNPQILTEAMQTVLRKHGVEEAYNILKQEFRGTTPNLVSMKDFVSRLSISETVKQEILGLLNPSSYTGLAVQLAEQAVDKYDAFRQSVNREYLSTRSA